MYHKFCLKKSDVHDDQMAHEQPFSGERYFKNTPHLASEENLTIFESELIKNARKIPLKCKINGKMFHTHFAENDEEIS